MTVDKNKTTRDRLRASAALTGACAVLTFGTARAETHFEPHIEFDATWTDNVELAPPGTSKRDEFIGQLKPGITLLHEGRNLRAFLDYELQAIYFLDAADSQVFHNGELGMQYAAIPDWFFIDLGAARTQTVIDPRQPINMGNLFQVGNLANQTSGQITPILKHTFRVAEIEASYTRGFLDYSQANTVAGTQPVNLNFDDSRNESASFALRSPEPDALVTWETRYRHDKVDYDIAETYKYDIATAELGLRVARALRLIAQGGLESDPLRNVSTGGLDESSYKGGFEWRRGERTIVRALAGHRFFGTTYEGMWRYTGRVLESDVSYDEGPTTQTQTRVVRSVTAPGEFPPGVNPAFSRATPDVYVLKALEGHIGLRGRVTGIFLSANSERRQYLLLGGLEDRYRGASVLVTRRLGQRVTLDATAGYVDSKLREGVSYKDHTYAITLARQIGSRTNLTLSGNRVDRVGGDRPYAANWAMLGITVNFAGNEAGVGGGGFRGGAHPATPGNMLPTVPR